MASLGATNGYPQLAGQATNGGKYTPEIFSQKILRKFYLSTVMSEIANTDYEGEIKAAGDKVIIRTVPDMTIRDYVKGQDLVYEAPTSPEVELEINKAKYYAARIDKIDEVQNDVNLMNKWSDDAGQKMKIAIETDVFSFYSDAVAANKGATAGAISAGFDLGVAGTPVQASISTTTAASHIFPAVDLLMAAEAVLSEQNVPEEDRWIIIPAWYAYQLQTGDLRRADSTGSSADGVLRNGKLGRIGNFTIYRSNNLPKSGTSTIIPFGHKSALTFAAQLTDNETLPHPTSFGTLLRGLQVYGYKTVLPSAMGYMVATKHTT